MIRGRGETRRHFLHHGIGAIPGTAALAIAARAGSTAPAAAEETVPLLDYGRSFVCHPGPVNAVRLWIESRTTIFDRRSGRATHYFQCASCKSENTFAPRDLFKADNYDFLPVIGGGHVLIFRRAAGLNPCYRETREQVAAWGEPQLRPHPADAPRALDTWEKINSAATACLPIVSRTEIACAETGLRAIIECPVKTLNLDRERKLYQVDTGPIAFPDLTAISCEPEIDRIRLAFVAFNTAGSADFVVEQPTPVLEGGKVLCQIQHYSGPFSLPARNALFALG